MLIDLGKVIGGPDEGDGVVGNLLHIFAGTAVLGGGAAGAGAVGDFGGGVAARGASGAATWSAEVGFGENFFANVLSDFFSGHGHGGNSFFDDWLRGTQKATWQAISEEAQTAAAAHGFILQQLRKHAGANPAINSLLTEYEGLKTKLPDPNLLKAIKSKLSGVLHTDRGGADGIAGQFFSAIDTLKAPKYTDAYKTAVYHDPKGMESILAKFADVGEDWYEKARAAVKPITDPTRLLGAEEGAVKAAGMFTNMSHGTKAALIFGGVAAVGLGAYYLYKRNQKHHHHGKHPHEQLTSGEVPFSILHKRDMADRNDPKHHSHTNMQR